MYAIVLTKKKPSARARRSQKSRKSRFFGNVLKTIDYVENVTSEVPAQFTVCSMSQWKDDFSYLNFAAVLIEK